ncbi:MAG: hypothetical protein Q8S21_06840 [Candidatus Paracaedibacteraceae bacterium]|nr:hypothetical protein [Candidatus Paracaedibacteraceae bacterium]
MQIVNSITSSECIAVSFLIFIGFFVWKRFFNVNAILDSKIKNIRDEIEQTIQLRENAHAQLQKVKHTFDTIDGHLTEIQNKATVTCETLVQSIRSELADEILKRKNVHTKQTDLLENNYKKIYQKHLIDTIIESLLAELSKQSPSEFHDQELKRSLALMHTLKINY